MRGAQDSVRHVYSDMVSINSGGGNGYTGAGIIQIQQRDLTNLHRTTEVVNSRVRRLWRCRSRRIGTVSRKSRTNGLSFTSFSNFEIVIWLSPPAPSLNRIAPSLRKSDLHRISAFSEKIRCAQGKTENKCPPSGWYHVGPKLANIAPPVSEVRTFSEARRQSR